MSSDGTTVVGQRITDWVKKRKYEEALGVSFSATRDQIDEAHLRLSHRFRNFPQVQDAINQAKSLLIQEGNREKGRRLSTMGTKKEALPYLEKAFSDSGDVNDEHWYGSTLVQAQEYKKALPLLEEVVRKRGLPGDFSWVEECKRALAAQKIWKGPQWKPHSHARISKRTAKAVGATLFIIGILVVAGSLYSSSMNSSPANKQPTVADVYEPDGSFSEYGTLYATTQLQSQSRSLSPAGDKDYIRFYAYAGNKYIFYTEGSTDTRGRIYDSYGNQLILDANSGVNNNFRIEYVIVNSGYYFLMIDTLYTDTTGPYILFYKYETTAYSGNYVVTVDSYSWIDAVTNGTIVANGDDVNAQVNLPFSFTFYGSNYSGVYVCSNGILTFGSRTTAHVNVAIPNNATPNNFIAPFWDDLNPAANGSGKIYYKSFSRQVVVTWENVYLFTTTKRQKFQAILYDNGEIRFQYHTLTSGYSCTIGVENANGTKGTAYSGSLYNGLALKFVYNR